jgi:phosphoglycolate phosphatase-like HAD superfamily hydrolase
VLFDIDGTLLRGAGSHHRDALVEGIRRVTGHRTTLEGVSTSGMLDRDLIAHMLRAAGASERRIRSALREIMAECQGAYQDLCGIDLSTFICSGARELLADLRERGAVLGLVSGNLGAIGWRKVELAGLRDYFSFGAFAEDGTSRARLALIAARRATKLNGGRPERISLIGDHANDVLAAKANGFRAVAVASGLMPFEELSALNPDILVRNLKELNASQLL